MHATNEFEKFKAENKFDISFELTNLKIGETIASYLVTVPDGITKVTDSITENIVTVRLAGGTEGVVYKIFCQFFTTGTSDRDPVLVINVIVL